MDEAHEVRSIGSLFIGARAIAENANVRVAITATPVVNDILVCKTLFEQLS